MAVAVTFDFKFDDIVLDALSDALDRAPETMRQVVEGPIRQRIEGTLLVRLKTAPGPPKYPLKWRSDKQRRFVMAKLRRAGNLPYRRTGLLTNSWAVALAFDGHEGSIAVTNAAPYARFVVGGPITGDSVRQPMFPHFYDARALIAEAAGAAEDDLTDAWFAILDTPGAFA